MSTLFGPSGYDGKFLKDEVKIEQSNVKPPGDLNKISIVDGDIGIKAEQENAEKHMSILCDPVRIVDTSDSLI